MENKIKLKLIGTIMITIALSFLVNLTRPETDYSAITHDWFWANKTHQSDKFSIIFYGDSRIYRGVSPEAVNAFFANQKILNLGFSSGGLNEEMLTFSSQFIDTSSKDKIIVLGVTPFSLTEEARKNEHFHQELHRTFADILERKYINPFLTFFEPIKLTDYQSTRKSKYPQLFHQDGWVESFKLPINTEEAIPSYTKQFNATKISQKSIEETMNFIQKMKLKGVKVYGFRPPSTQKMEDLENELSGFDENQFKIDFEKNGGIWIDIPNRFSFESFDGSHLHYESAKKLSIILAKKIKQ